MCDTLYSMSDSNQAFASFSGDLIRGHTDTIILGLLLDGNRYGFEIYKEIIKRSAGQYELKEPTLYTAFRRLEKQGWVESYWGEETQGARRRYYRITPLGREIHAQNLLAWEQARKIIEKLLGKEET